MRLLYNSAVVPIQWWGIVVEHNEPTPMPASVNHNCPSCGTSHELILYAADAFNWADTYEYTCPSTADLVCVQIASFGVPTNVKPENAVSVTRIAGLQ
jgi:hypothetical protein